MNNVALYDFARKLAGRMLPIVGAMLLEAAQRKLQESVPQSVRPLPTPAGGPKKGPRQRRGLPPLSDSPTSLGLGNQQLP